MQEHQKIVTRFAPSPTGKLHSGSYRTAIFAYLFARKNHGSFVLRIEDTDRERSKKEYEENILESLEWLGLEHDKFFRQSDNILRHKEILKQLIGGGHAYISKEEAKDGSGIMKELVRFKNPNTDVSFEDEIKGRVTVNTKELGDFVIAKNMDEPLFHLAVVVDDFDESVTHVIRGEDHVSNTPRQILIQRAIGAPEPVYAHLPLVLGLDKQKLSKRKGALALTDYRDLGYLPEALLNMISMIGWNPGGEQEIFSKDELVASFDLSRVQKSPAIFNPEKLDWYDREHIKRLPKALLLGYVKKFLPESILSKNPADENLESFIAIIGERLTAFGEIRKMSERGELLYFFERPEYDAALLLGKDGSAGETKDYLSRAAAILESLSDFSKESVKNALWGFATEVGRSKVLWPLRVALSGLAKSPDPFVLSAYFGKDETLERIKIATELLSR